MNEFSEVAGHKNQLYLEAKTTKLREKQRTKASRH